MARYAVMQRGDFLSVYCPKVEPVILSTEYTSETELEKFENIGIKGTIKKPIVMKELATLIRKILREQKIMVIKIAGMLKKVATTKRALTAFFPITNNS